MARARLPSRKLYSARCTLHLESDFDRKRAGRSMAEAWFFLESGAENIKNPPRLCKSPSFTLSENSIER